MDNPHTAFIPTRWNGWTVTRRDAFTTVLAETGHVGAAARAAGLSRVSAYRCRARDADFARAWDAALAQRDAARRARHPAPDRLERLLDPPPTHAALRAMLGRYARFAARAPSGHDRRAAAGAMESRSLSAGPIANSGRS